MISKDIKFLWTVSSAVFGGGRIMRTARRIGFCLHALAVYGAVRPLINAPSQSSLSRLMARRPETVGALAWPYQCSGWSARTKLERIWEHFDIVDHLGGVIDFPSDGQVVLADLTEIRPGLRLIVDQPQWFIREGQLTINLFLDETRIYSLAFSLFREGDKLAAFVGAIQGRDIEGVLDQYRELTKAANGMRPRDLLIELFRVFCRTIGVRHIFAVSDKFRIHRSAWFGVAEEKLSTNYDEIWKDRGGVPAHPMFYRLAVDVQHRDLSEVPSKKRGMYRRRYDMLDSITARMMPDRSGLEHIANSPTKDSDVGEPVAR